MSSEQSNIKTRDEFIDLANYRIDSNTLLRYFLIAGATFAGGLLSYAGVVALGFSPTVAFSAFVLNSIVSIQMNKKFITNGIDKRIIPLFNKLSGTINTDINLKTSLFYILISLLATVSFSATTLYAALELFSPLIAIGISLISGLAYFPYCVEVLNKFLKFYTKDNINSKIQKFYDDLGDKSLNHKRAILLALLSLVVPICIGAIVLTMPSWLYETFAGLSKLLPAILPMQLTLVIVGITASCQIISNSLLIATSPLKAVFKLGDFEPKNALSHIPSSPGVNYNPAMWLVIASAETTAVTLFLSHCLGHAFMSGSRNYAATGVTTAADAYTDGSVIFIRSSKPHSHEPFDSIILGAKLIVTLIPQLIAIPIHMLISRRIDRLSNTNQNRILSDYLELAIKDCYYFVYDYLAKKQESKQHDLEHKQLHGCCESHTGSQHQITHPVENTKQDAHKEEHQKMDVALTSTSLSRQRINSADIPAAPFERSTGVFGFHQDTRVFRTPEQNIDSSKRRSRSAEALANGTLVARKRSMSA